MNTSLPMRLLPILTILASAGLATAATIRVPGDLPTIQAAIDSSRSGDHIVVAAGTYGEPSVNFGFDRADFRAAPMAFCMANICSLHSEIPLSLNCFSNAAPSLFIETTWSQSLRKSATSLEKHSSTSG